MKSYAVPSNLRQVDLQMEEGSTILRWLLHQNPLVVERVVLRALSEDTVSCLSYFQLKDLTVVCARNSPLTLSSTFIFAIIFLP